MKSTGAEVNIGMGHNLCLDFGADEHPCTTYFDVHLGVQGFDPQPYLSIVPICFLFFLITTIVTNRFGVHLGHIATAQSLQVTNLPSLSPNYS